MHTIIIGRNHGDRSRWMKDLKLSVPDPRGFFTESVADPSIGGIRIYMREIGGSGHPGISCESELSAEEQKRRDSDEFIGTCVNRHTESCVRGYEHILPALRSIPDGAHVIMDHLGSMDGCCPGFQEAVLELFDRCSVLAAIPDRIPDYLAPVLDRSDIRVFCADRDSLNEAKACLQ